MTIVFAKVLSQMNDRGARTVRSLGRVFRTTEGNGNRKVEAQEFFVGLNEVGCKLTKQEIDAFLLALDTDQDGNVNYDAFLQGIRGSMN